MSDIPPLPEPAYGFYSWPPMHTDGQMQARDAMWAAKVAALAQEIEALKHDIERYTKIAAEQATEIDALNRAAPRDFVLRRGPKWVLASEPSYTYCPECLYSPSQFPIGDHVDGDGAPCPWRPTLQAEGEK